MQGQKSSILIFDHINDLVYMKCSSGFAQHIQTLATSQGLLDQVGLENESVPSSNKWKGNKDMDPNILIQIFSPLVTSQRFMKEQFGNPYSSLQCKDGTNLVFHDYMGFLFLGIGTEEVVTLRRYVLVAITLVTYLCGPDVSLLKASNYHSTLLEQLLSSWTFLRKSDDSFILEGVRHIKVNQQLNTSLMKSLQSVITKIQPQLGHSLHVMIFVETQLLSILHSAKSHSLSAADVLFLILLCHRTTTMLKRKEDSSPSATDSDENTSGGNNGRTGFVRLPSKEERNNHDSSTSSLDDSVEEANEKGWTFIEHLNIHDKESGTNDGDDDLLKYHILLKNDDVGFTPSIVHLGIVQEELYFIVVSEPQPSTLSDVISCSATAYEQSLTVNDSQRDPSSDKPLFDKLETTIKKLQDLLKKQKHFSFRNEVGARWDRVKVGFQHYLKTKEVISIQTSPLSDICRQIFRYYFDPRKLCPLPLNETQAPLALVWKQIKTDTEDFWGFLRLKAKLAASANGSSKTNLLLESRENLSINKYLEDFPGLVHFIYVDRSVGQEHSVIFPTVDFSKDTTIKLTKNKIRGMVNFAREHMSLGHFSIMWKDGAFSYAYFLWFEDHTGYPIRPQTKDISYDGYPIPGVLCGDFYKRLMTDSFPNTPLSSSSSKQPGLRCVELFCIHLGLITSSCVLEHTRRLATNIFDEFCNGMHKSKHNNGNATTNPTKTVLTTSTSPD